MCVFIVWCLLVVGCKKPTDGQIKLTELIKFFSEVKIHDHANYFVDSLWDHTEVLQVSGAVLMPFRDLISLSLSLSLSLRIGKP